MLYLDEPFGFSSQAEIAGCFMEVDEKILLLLRQDHKSKGNTWGAPGGKIERGESPVAAAKREIWEETGIVVPLESLSYFKKTYVRYADVDFVYHIFHCHLLVHQSVHVNMDEHKAWKWVTPQEALVLDLMEDEDTCIKMFFNL